MARGTSTVAFSFKTLQDIAFDRDTVRSLPPPQYRRVLDPPPPGQRSLLLCLKFYKFHRQTVVSGRTVFPNGDVSRSSGLLLSGGGTSGRNPHQC
jgi:hypothetical protein